MNFLYEKYGFISLEYESEFSIDFYVERHAKKYALENLERFLNSIQLFLLTH